MNHISNELDEDEIWGSNNYQKNYSFYLFN